MRNLKNYEDWHTKMLAKGIKRKKVYFYPDILFDRLRPYCVGGIPASIMLFCNELCNGKCYDRAMLMQLAFTDAKVVHADINSLRVQGNGEFPEHAFVETTDFGGGKTWVVDTSVGLVYEKNYYYKLEEPKINHIISKEECMRNPEIQEILASNFKSDVQIMPLIMPNIEAAINNSRHIGTFYYKDKLNEEINRFKQAINYDQMIKEIKEDMKKSPRELDEKFGIVRDKYGREISRGGVPNPYYKSIEEIEKDNAEYNKARKSPEKLEEYFNKLVKSVEEEHDREFKIIREKAQRRMQEISENPTQNFYEENEA